MPRFWKITPGGNPTLLLHADDIAPSQRVNTALTLMSPLHLGGEQSGFVRLHPQPAAQLKNNTSGISQALADSKNEGKGHAKTQLDPATEKVPSAELPHELPRLDMMGGEFCLNATRAFAALLAAEGLLPCISDNDPAFPGLSPEKNDAEHPAFLVGGQVEVSGASAPVDVRVLVPALPWNPATFPACQAWACLFFDELPMVKKVDTHISLVRLPGICHLILDKQSPPDEKESMDLCAQLRQRFQLEQEEAVGCLWLDSSQAIPAVTPLVWVRETQSLCRESACGSGTLACALFLAKHSGATNIRQPSGECLSVDICPAPNGFAVWTGGPVRMVACGHVFLDTL